MTEDRRWLDPLSASPDGPPLDDDRGFLHGEGLFETLLVQGGRVFRLQPHLDRLQASALALGHPLPEGDWRGRVAAALDDAARSCTSPRGRARITLTAGPSAPGGDPAVPPQGPPRLMLHLRPLAGEPADPSRVWWVKAAPPPASGGRSALDGHKTLSYYANLLCLRQARDAGADEGLRVTTASEVVGGSRSNIFMVDEGGRLVTPPLTAGALPGITRAIVLGEIAPRLGIEIAEERFDLQALEHAKEAFTTSSLAGIRPVALLRGGPPGPPDGNRKGEITHGVQKAYGRLLARELGTE